MVSFKIKNFKCIFSMIPVSIIIGQRLKDTEPIIVCYSCQILESSSTITLYLIFDTHEISLMCLHYIMSAIRHGPIAYLEGLDDSILLSFFIADSGFTMKSQSKRILESSSKSINSALSPCSAVKLSKDNLLLHEYICSSSIFLDHYSRDHQFTSNKIQFEKLQDFALILIGNKRSTKDNNYDEHSIRLVSLGYKKQLFSNNNNIILLKKNKKNSLVRCKYYEYNIVFI
ncbi:hypothetical protein AGLY_006734 [Aphis glycines]|uniref:Uncharacterized protein n=1 Tax=Aphis glycines TaxID=307491 RepID=A0A6G0TSF5_APHGL|nr:hypothetical protein AGLY_006734 [Aphis glycines]